MERFNDDKLKLVSPYLLIYIYNSKVKVLIMHDKLKNLLKKL